MTDDQIREELNQLVVAHRLTEIMGPFRPVDMVPAAVALDLLRQLRERGWIKCSERMPRNETPVLILHKGIQRIGELRTEYPSHEDNLLSYDYWDDPDDDGQDWEWSDITHWMPLPEPPKEEPHDR